MTDRELLERAAKACGYDTSHHWNAERMKLEPPIAALVIHGVSTYWDPLNIDGHALRLSSLLAIDILHRFVGGQRVEALAPGGGAKVEYCDTKTRPAATRRAIVRAAAAALVDNEARPATSNA